MRAHHTRVAKKAETFSIRLPTKTRDEVRRVACAAGMSMAAYIRDSVETTLRERTQLRDFVLGAEDEL